MFKFKKIGKRLLSGTLAICLTVTTLFSNVITASAATNVEPNSKLAMSYGGNSVGGTGSYQVYMLWTANTTDGSGSGMDAVYNITLSGNGENLNVFCIGYGKSIPSNQYIERNVKDDSHNAPITNRDLQKALGAVVYYGYASHKNVAYYIATQALVWELVTPVSGLTGTKIPRNYTTFELQNGAYNNGWETGQFKGTYQYMCNAARSKEIREASRAAYTDIEKKVKAYLGHPIASLNNNSTKKYTLKKDAVSGEGLASGIYSIKIPLSALRLNTTEKITSFASACSGKINCKLSKDSNYYVLWVNDDAAKKFGTKDIVYNRVIVDSGLNLRLFRNRANETGYQPLITSSGIDPMRETVRFVADYINTIDVNINKVAYDANGNKLTGTNIPKEVINDARFVVGATRKLSKGGTENCAIKVTGSNGVYTYKGIGYSGDYGSPDAAPLFS